MTKRRQIGMGVLALTGILFFCGGVFFSSWNQTSAQYSQGVMSGPEGAVPQSGFKDYQADSGTKANVAAITGNRPVNVARPLEVPPLYAFDSKVDPLCQQIVIVDSETKRVCVYHVRYKDNKCTIELAASRNFEFDLKLDDFNGSGSGLSPLQIREQVQQSGNKP